jgi:hypothetical protein
MRTDTLIAKLKEKGFILPTCLRWTGADIDARLRAIGQGDQVKLISLENKQMILESFFDEYEDQICEFINQQLEDHLEALTHYQPLEEPF